MLTVMASLWDRNTASLDFLVRGPRTDFVFTLLMVTALKWFDGDGTVSKYEGARDLTALVELCVTIFSATRMDFSYAPFVVLQ